MQLSRRIQSFMTVAPALLLGTALSLGIGALCYVVTVRTIDRDNEERFHHMARTAQHTINARIRSYTNLLRGGASLFQAEPNVTRAKFRRYVTGLDLAKHYPAIETFNYAHWLNDQDRDAFEARMRREHEFAHDGVPPLRITPEGRRPNYHVVVFVEPSQSWGHTFGMDLNTLPLANKVISDSRDSGALSTSGAPIKAMKKRTGLGMRLPIYRAGAPLNSVEQRRAAYIGSLGIAFSAPRLVQGVLHELPLKTVRLSLFNRVDTLGASIPRPSQLIYDSSATTADSSPPLRFDDPKEFHVMLPVEFNGHQWHAYFSAPKAAVYRPSDTFFPLLAMLAGFTTTMLLYGLFYTLSTSRQRALELAKVMTRELRAGEAKLKQTNETLRHLAAHAENIKEYERKRIAQEIHDDLGQNLLALRIQADVLSSRTRARHPKLHAHARWTLVQIDATIKTVRQIINDLRPNVLDLGLSAAVDWQINQFRNLTGIACDLVESTREIQVSDRCATALFRILQESLNNVSRHARASQVRVELRRGTDWISMTVNDNGVGLPATGRHKPGSFGLMGMEERVNILGGVFAIGSAGGTGTTVRVALPVGELAAGAGIHAMADAMRPGSPAVV